MIDPDTELAFLNARAEIPSFAPFSVGHFIELSFAIFPMKNPHKHIDLKNIAIIKKNLLTGIHLKQTFQYYKICAWALFTRGRAPQLSSHVYLL